MHATYPDDDEPPPLTTALTPEVPDVDGTFVAGGLFGAAVMALLPGCCVCALGCALRLSCGKGEARNALRPVPGVMRPTGGVGTWRGAVLMPGRVVVLGIIGLTLVPGVMVPTCGVRVPPLPKAALLADIAPLNPSLPSDVAPRAALPVRAPAPTPSALAPPPRAPAAPPPAPPAARTLPELKAAVQRTAIARRMKPRARTGCSCGML
jgi:hypothetical protein